MKIQYENKQFINADIGTPNKNKVTDNDMNEIKAVVNHNADDLITAQSTITQYTQETDTRLGDMQDSFDDINDSITTIEGNIETIEDTTYTKTETDALLDTKATTTALGNEIQAREQADTNLQGQIDAIVSSSDVVDIVGTYTDLQNYDTSKLGDNDIIKVLDDSTHNNATSYYRWHNSTWNYVGSEGPYYTKSQTDALLNSKVNVVEGKGLSTNDFTDALKTKLDGIEANAQVNKLESVKVNGSTQPITNKSVDISVPTKTSDLTNDSNYVKDTDYATNSTGGVIKVANGYGIEVSNVGQIRARVNTYANYQNTDVASFVGKGTLENVLNAVVGDINSALDLINGESI